MSEFRETDIMHDMRTRKTFLAIDIGASSGRHIIGWTKHGEIGLTEVYRFENRLKKEGSSLCWDIEHLVQEVINGLKACHEQGFVPQSLAIDTWGVDYVLLDKGGNVIFPVYSYRDSRTLKAVSETESKVTFPELYRKSGIQKLSFNSVYQLWCDKKEGRLDKAEHLLMIPDYIAYMLTGMMHQEYTNATTTSLVNAREKTWDRELLGKYGFPDRLFGDLVVPGTCYGSLLSEISKACGFQTRVVAAPSHDTASAVAGTPLAEDELFISSGTWSLIGTELSSPVLTSEAREANFTNEGGLGYRFRLLKNYMGMWLFQNIKRNLGNRYSYEELMEMAMACPTHCDIDVNDPAFLAPDDMVEAIKGYLEKPDLTLAEVLNSVYHSLASSYRKATEEIERLTGKTIRSIRIVGGGSKDRYLNRLTEEYTGRKVFTGPMEGTAAGNLASQMMAYYPDLTLDELRSCIRRSLC